MLKKILTYTSLVIYVLLGLLFTLLTLAENSGSFASGGGRSSSLSNSDIAEYSIVVVFWLALIVSFFALRRQPAFWRTLVILTFPPVCVILFNSLVIANLFQMWILHFLPILPLFFGVPLFAVYVFLFLQTFKQKLLVNLRINK